MYHNSVTSSNYIYIYICNYHLFLNLWGGSRTETLHAEPSCDSGASTALNSSYFKTWQASSTKTCSCWVVSRTSATRKAGWCGKPNNKPTIADIYLLGLFCFNQGLLAAFSPHNGQSFRLCEQNTVFEFPTKFTKYIKRYVTVRPIKSSPRIAETTVPPRPSRGKIWNLVVQRTSFPIIYIWELGARFWSPIRWMNTSGSTGKCVDKKVRVQPCNINPHDCVDIALKVVWGGQDW